MENLSRLYQACIATGVRQLMRSVQRVEAGNLDFELPAGRQDEVGELTRVFNRMTAAVREHQEKIADMLSPR